MVTFGPYKRTPHATDTAFASRGFRLNIAELKKRRHAESSSSSAPSAGAPTASPATQPAGLDHQPVSPRSSRSSPRTPRRGTTQSLPQPQSPASRTQHEQHKEEILRDDDDVGCGHSASALDYRSQLTAIVAAAHADFHRAQHAHAQIIEMIAALEQTSVGEKSKSAL